MQRLGWVLADLQAVFRLARDISALGINADDGSSQEGDVGNCTLLFASLVEVNGVVWLDDRDLEGSEKMGFMIEKIIKREEIECIVEVSP